jgi:hypothetical protein
LPNCDDYRFRLMLISSPLSAQTALVDASNSTTYPPPHTHTQLLPASQQALHVSAGRVHLPQGLPPMLLLATSPPLTNPHVALHCLLDTSPQFLLHALPHDASLRAHLPTYCTQGGWIGSPNHMAVRQMQLGSNGCAANLCKHAAMPAPVHPRPQQEAGRLECLLW